MYSSTPSLDSSFVLNDSGSSSTSPSRLPRMLVEYHPERPSMRALKAGASTVFIMVWPVLKSLPPIGRARRAAPPPHPGAAPPSVGERVPNPPTSTTGPHARSIDSRHARDHSPPP